MSTADRIAQDYAELLRDHEEFVESLEKLIPGDIDGDAAVTSIILDWFSALLGDGPEMPPARVRRSQIDLLGDEALSDLNHRLWTAITDIEHVRADRS